MDFSMKASLTALIVAAVMLAARHLGNQMAGLLAGLPLTTAPTLAWVGVEHGAAAAAQASIGSVAGCSLVCVFAVTYARAARRFSPLVTMGVALVVLLAGSALGRHVGISLWLASGSALLASWCALKLMRAPAARDRATTSTLRPRFALVSTAVSAGLVSASIASMGSIVDPQLAGLLAAWPMVGFASVVATHASTGVASATSFLRAYVVSSLGKAAFGAVFALAAVQSGIAAAMGLALLVGVGICVATFNLIDCGGAADRQAL